MPGKKILFISRKYPPSVGGMQTYTKNLLDNLRTYYKVDAILLSRGQVHLLWFLPYAIIKSVFLSAKNGYDVFYMGDALLAPIGLILKNIFKGKAIVTVHGLDITYPNAVYQSFIPKAVCGYDKVICVSRNTMEECKTRGISPSICSFIPNGMNPDEYYLDIPRSGCISELEKALNMRLGGRKIILTAGRLMKRKGIDLFLDKTFPILGNNFIYFICGKGPLKERIGKVIKERSLSDRVFILNEVSQGLLKLLYNCADVFVMPNRRIKDDVEGFGIVAIEAASCGAPVVANNVDGINEAVLDGKTGWLVEDNNTEKFLEKIKNPGLDRNAVRQEAMSFSWSRLIIKYKEIIDGI